MSYEQLIAPNKSVPEGFIDFTTRGNGSVEFADTGQLMHMTSTTYKAAGTGAPRISGGKWSLAAGTVDTPVATYLHMPLSDNGMRVGAEWTVAADDGGLGAAGVILWGAVYLRDFGYPNVPPARLHLSCIPHGGTWSLYVCNGTGAAGGFPVVASGAYATPAFDGTALWTIDASIDPVSGNVNIICPDGTRATVLASTIYNAAVAAGFLNAGPYVPDVRKLPGNFAVIEHFATHPIAPAVFPAFTKFWASTTP